MIYNNPLSKKLRFKKNSHMKLKFSQRVFMENSVPHS
jgi:hypothetical protein